MKQENYRTIEDRLECIEKELLQVKAMLISFTTHAARPISAPEEELLNVKDVAQFLKVEAAVIYAACNHGEISFIKVGKMYKFRKADIIGWVETKKEIKKEHAREPDRVTNTDTNKLPDVDAYVNKYLQKHSLRG